MPIGAIIANGWKLPPTISCHDSMKKLVYLNTISMPTEHSSDAHSINWRALFASVREMRSAKCQSITEVTTISKNIHPHDLKAKNRLNATTKSIICVLR